MKFISGIVKKYSGKVMIDNLNTLLKKKFIRNVITVATGTAAAQIITMILSPVITRLYGPENYGIMGTFLAIIGIFIPIAALTYPTAMVLPKSNKDAIGLARLSILVAFIISLISAFIILLFHKPIVKVFNIETVSSYLFLIPLAIFLGGCSEVFEQWLIRTRQFRITARVSIIQSLIIQGGKASVGYFHPMAIILVYFSAVQEGIKVILMYFSTRSSEEKLSFSIFREKVNLKKLAQQYKDFPIFRAPQVFLNAASQSLPILMLTTFFGPAAAGLYSLSRTVLNVPSTLIGKSVGDVFYPRIAQAANEGEKLTYLIKKATISLAIVGIVPYSLIVIFGPWLFSFVFGEGWLVAGEYARWLSIWIFFMFINQPSVRAIQVLNAQSFHLKFSMITLVLRTITLIIGYFIFSSDQVAIALFAVSGAILNLILIMITLKLSKRYDR